MSVRYNKLCKITMDKKMRAAQLVNMKNFIQRASILLFALVFCVSTAVPCLAADDGKSAQNVSATNENSEVVRVGYYLSDGYQEYDEKNGIYSGYSYEFLMALQQYTNWKYEFVQCSFGDGLKLLENGEIDLMNNVSKTEERESIYEFSSLASGENIAYVAMKAGDTRVAMNDLDAIENIKIALAKDSIYSDRLVAYLTANNVDTNILWFDDREGAEQAFNSGEADAYIVTSSTITDEHIILRYSPDSYYLATTKGNDKLIGEVNEAIESLRANDPSLEMRLHNKYYGQATEDYTVLTESEKEYLEANPVTRVLYQTSWYPISYQDKDGEFAGAIRGVYDLLEQRTGMKFEFVPYDENNDSDSITEGYNCLMMAEQPTDFSGSGIYDVKLTKSFITPSLTTISNHVIAQGDTLVLVDGDYLSELSQHIYKDKVNYIFVDSVEECLSTVKNKKADGTVLITYESEFYRHQRQYRELTYTIVDTGSYGFSMAVSNEADPRLYSIVSKGLNSISAGEISNVFNNTLQSLDKTDFWTNVSDNPVPAFLIFALLVSLATGMVMSWIFVRKLNEKNEELIRANAATNQFFSRMSHDMRTPMNGILGLSRLAQEDTDPQVWKDSLVKVEESGEYLLSLINDTLDFQRIESGNLKLQNEIVNCQDLIRNVAELVAPSAKAKNIDFRIVNRNTILDCYIWVDPVRVKQIFINLISNAIKFTPEGGTISVEYECKERKEMISCDRFYIRDTGIGMSQEYIDKQMFKPFVQEHSEVTGQYAGSGLGLSIVKSLVDLMGGTIQVESELGTGTTFILDIDFERVHEEDVEKHLAQEEKKHNAVVQSISGRRALLVEDHPLNAEITRKLLEKAGCIVDWAKDGQDGVNVFNNSKIGTYDVVLMDIRMPVMDGLEAAKAIRALERKDAKTVPIIAMTANAYEEDARKSMEAGMNAHLAKPIDPVVMYETITNELQESSAHYMCRLRE